MESSQNEPVCIRVLIVDDQPRVRQSLEALLTALGWRTPGHAGMAIQIVGEADNGDQAVERVDALRPDVVVLDLPMHGTAKHAASGPEPDGLAAIRTIKHRWPAIKIVVFTMYATDRAAVLLAGADIFLLKGCPTSELLAAVTPTFR